MPLKTPRSTVKTSKTTRGAAMRVVAMALGTVGALSVVSSPAGASGKTDGSSTTPKPATGCANILSLTAYPTSQAKFYVTGTVTSCGTAISNYTTRVTDTATHSDSACAIRPDNYKWHSSISPNETLMFWQIGGSGMCVTDSYNLRVDVMEGNTVLASAITTWSPPA